jgi:hypothetical protein
MIEDTTEDKPTGTVRNSIDPAHSRPLDVHVFSEHPEVSIIIEGIWKENFAVQFAATSRKGGAKPKSDYRQQLRVLILDLYVAWKTDPGLCIGVHLSNTAWNTNSRYNALRLSRVIPLLVHRLAEVGLIDLAKGSYSGPGAPTNRTARMIAAEPLCVLFRQAHFGLQHIHTAYAKEVIIMHDDSKAGREVEYKDSDQTQEMRTALQAYNQLLSRTFVDVPDQVEPHLERPIRQGPRTGEIMKVAICSAENHVRRVFNREDWTCGGRYFGGWWQQVGSEFRKRVHINGRPTVEVDYQALHIAILNAGHGKKTIGDPYALAEGLIPETTPREQRKLVKKLVLMALNAKDRATACQAFRQGCAVGSAGKTMTNKELLVVLDAFAERHPHLKDDLCADRGISLMNVDSQIASHVIDRLTQEGIPVLCVHDSFIIDYEKAEYLKQVMVDATQQVIGCRVTVSWNYMGLDETAKHTPDYLEDYITFRHRDPCRQYSTRQRLFTERVAYLDSAAE